MVSVVGLLALTACSPSETSSLGSELGDREDELPSCAADACTEEVAVLVAALAELPGVVRLVEPRYREEQSTNGAGLTGTVIVDSGERCETLREPAAELGWTSSVSPLSSIRLQCEAEEPGSAQGSHHLFTEVRPTSREQLEQWGDRGTLRPPG
ncbi:hypothetical protein [Nocardioides sp. LML1-1-1.1]|uniref:hypothetical protein n=1 Tax=Nocardioides sp. LML1-1-1.1 TaxID=3135248 RepID=UPI0034234607